jgi:hypothetical protein
MRIRSRTDLVESHKEQILRQLPDRHLVSIQSSLQRLHVADLTRWVSFVGTR